MAQVIECLSKKCKALSQIPYHQKTKPKQKHPSKSYLNQVDFKQAKENSYQNIPFRTMS
jgi:hypothetical protein